MNIYNYTKEELENILLENNDSKFRATQIYEWIYKKKISDFNEMKNISKKTISFLEENFNLDKPKLLTKQEDTNTYKFLFELDDSNKIEAVLMIHDYGNSLCISSQVGCNMGCLFCESGRLKKVRNLNPHEMISQILKVEEETNLNITHIVIMGIGEPFDNYKSLLKFISIVNDPKGINMGSRHITVSTCGIPDKILEFAKDGKQVNLAISLHAPTDLIRNKLMPINKAHNIRVLLDAVKKYIEITNRRVTFEYIMLKNINDSKEEALELSRLLKGMNCYVNLIPYNTTNAEQFLPSETSQILVFYDILKKNKINVTIRKEFGSKINAACGQLRSNYEEEIS